MSINSLLRKPHMCILVALIIASSQPIKATDFNTSEVNLQQNTYNIYQIEDMKNILHTSCEKLQKHVTLYCKGMEPEKISDYIQKIIQSHYAFGEIKSSLYVYDGKVKRIDLDITYTTEYRLLTTYQHSELLRLLSDKEKVYLNKAVSILDSLKLTDLNDFQKERKIHDYIIFNTTYNLKTKLNCFSVESILENNEGVCDAYTKLFFLLSNMAGVKCIKECGYALNSKGEVMGRHAWNIVRIDDKDYYVDVTWDDLDNDTLKYTYFNLPKSLFNERHKAYESNLSLDELFQAL